MDYENLTEEQRARARECTSTQELLALVKEEGLELTDEQLEALSGGSIIDWDCVTDFLWAQFDRNRS